MADREIYIILDVMISTNLILGTITVANHESAVNILKKKFYAT